MVNFLQLLLLCCLLCSLCWLTGWISLLWGNEVVLRVGKVTCMEIDDAVHNCKHGGGILKVEKGAAPFLGSLEQPASVDTDSPLAGGCSHCGASPLAAGRHISSLILCIFFNGLPRLIYSLSLLFCQNTNQLNSLGCSSI